MSFLYKLIRAIISALSLGRTDPEIESAKEPGTLSRESGSDGYTIRFYSSDTLREKNGYWPEKLATQALANALDEHDIGYEIVWGDETTLKPPTESPYNDDFATIQWIGEQSFGDEDVIILLTYDNGGVTGGNKCVSGARSLDKYSSVVESGSDSDARTLHAILHEAGHALGAPGDVNPEEEGTTTTGFSWVEDGKWHRTLMNSTEDEDENACGDTLARREDRPVVFHQRFCDCAVSYFD